MISFPESTRVHRRMPKDAFYKHLQLTTALKDKFVSDVDSIFMEWSLTKDNLNLEKDGEVTEILILYIDLKKQEFDAKIIEVIARQNPHKLVFVMSFEDKRQLAIYHSKLYRTDWIPEEKVVLSARGFSLDDIWESLIEQVALTEEKESEPEFSIDDRLERQERIEKLQKQIEKTEALAWKEQQPKKKFEIYNQLQDYKKQLEDLKNGKA